MAFDDVARACANTWNSAKLVVYTTTTMTLDPQGKNSTIRITYKLRGNLYWNSTRKGMNVYVYVYVYVCVCRMCTKVPGF